MRVGTLAAGILVVLLVLDGLAVAQEPRAMDGGAKPAPKPLADTKEPGKTATDAVTNPAAVPPSEGTIGTSKSPQIDGAIGNSSSRPTPTR